MSVGIVTNLAVVQSDVVKSNPPSLMYDSKGLLKVAFESLQAGCSPQNAKELHDVRIRILESNLRELQSRAEDATFRSLKTAIGVLVISLCYPPATLAAITTGVVSRIIDDDSSWCSAEKRQWLQVELDAEKAFAETAPEKVGDAKARDEFVYKFIFDHEPGYTIEKNGLTGTAQGWEANRHIFPEAQAKYDEIAKNKPLPVEEYIDFD